MNKQVVSRNIRKMFTTEDVFLNNEIKANILAQKVTLLVGSVFVAAWIMNTVGIFSLDNRLMSTVTLQVVLETMIPYAISVWFKCDKPFIKYMFVIELTVVLARLDSILSYNVELMMVVPILLACRYYSAGFTLTASALTVFLFGISAFCASYLGMAEIDLNYIYMKDHVVLDLVNGIAATLKTVGFDRGIYTRAYMLENYLPRMIAFGIITVVCTAISRYGREMVLEQKAFSDNQAKIAAELSLAGQIQQQMLPGKQFEDARADIAALMLPAKSVGGDFYDYFMVDDNHLAVAIADVSGKGIPAALFMARAKSLIKNLTMEGLSPEEVFARANNQLLEGNDAMLFVTAFLAVIDLTTGEMCYANAGHNPPVISGKEDSAEFLRDKPELVLAGIEDMTYTCRRRLLKKGDRLLLYTDGVTETQNINNELFGEERLLNMVSSGKDHQVQTLLPMLSEKLDQFRGEADQFDDITVLAVDYAGQEDIAEAKRCFAASDSALNDVTAFVRSFFREASASEELLYQMELVTEEIFVNIAHYGYDGRHGEAEVGLKKKGSEVTLTFKDDGKPFNPLSEEHSVSEALASDRIGGLGIALIRKMTDGLEYRYENGKNCLTVIKRL